MLVAMHCLMFRMGPCSAVGSNAVSQVISQIRLMDPFSTREVGGGGVHPWALGVPKPCK
jgi:hypothetical protein